MFFYHLTNLRFIIFYLYNIYIFSVAFISKGEIIFFVNTNEEEKIVRTVKKCKSFFCIFSLLNFKSKKIQISGK
jgi:hypothetical protein